MSSTETAAPVRPLIVRLRNWVGDVILGVPALRLLQSRGYTLQLVGRRWAGSLLAGEGWTVQPLSGDGWRARAAQMRQLRAQCRALDPGFDRRVNTLVLPFSTSSALDARLAGLRAMGYGYEGRSLLLKRALPRTMGIHELRTYWNLACALLDEARSEPPPSIALAVSAEAQQAAQRRLAGAGIADGYVVLCPFAGGTFSKKDKRWPEFARFSSEAARAWGRPLLLCPGPGEAAQAHADFPGATVLENVPLGEYAALLQRCALMVSNDTGPGHLAAAVGAPLLSVLGPTDAAQWGPWGPTTMVLQDGRSWPGVDQVLDSGRALLARR